MHVITITTHNYALNTLRLVKSLKRLHTKCKITVYSDDATDELLFSQYGVKLHFLPEIETLGVKRAKFLAYSHAAKGGGFIYMDSDILVLQSLDSLIRVSHFTACRDDMSECQYIIDKARPWKNHPQWTAERYFNSGVFAVPAGFDRFFDLILQEAMDDRDWNSIVVPGKLYDNHYLCAKVAQYDIQVCFISEHEYNWQGFRRFNELNCYVDEAGVLRNKPKGTPLRLVHFAGIQNIDAYLASLPTEITKILAMSIAEDPSGFLEAMNISIRNPVGIEERLRLQLVKSMAIMPCVDQYRPGAELPLLNEAAAATSIALSTTATDFLWNNLKCGGSYLSAAEYKALRDFILAEKVSAILEFGAGYTTTLFSRLVKKQVALEGWEGPWLDFARINGCEVRIVAFSSETGFDERHLQVAIKDTLSISDKSMVFIDSPPGTANRSLVIEQVVRHIPDADYYVVHDSIRDSANVYRLASTLGLQVIDHFSSWRGMTYLGRTAQGSCVPKKNNVAITEICAMATFAVDYEEAIIDKTAVNRVFIKLKNTGDVVFPTGRDGGLLFSLHLIGLDGYIIAWDTPRYTLPVDLAPEDTVAFWVSIPSDYGRVGAFDCDFVKEGEFWWSSISGTQCPRVSLI